LTGATLNRETTCLKTIIRRAVLNRQLDRNPLEGLSFQGISKVEDLDAGRIQKANFPVCG